MKLYICTDMEGISGVRSYEAWAHPEGKYYEDGKRLTTLEVNAAIDGFFEGGITDITVLDGHGDGGINLELLDSRVQLICPQKLPWPFCLDASYEAIAWVGQHAKAGTERAHIAHTGWFDIIDFRINELSVGEFGYFALLAAEIGVYPLFGSGDTAFCDEARALVPEIFTVSVKTGLHSGDGRECDEQAYAISSNSAIHLAPRRARALIREGARYAAREFIRQPKKYAPPIHPPYFCVVEYRQGNRPARIVEKYANDMVDLLNQK